MNFDDFQFVMTCPHCDAMFWPQNQVLMRAGTVPQEDCETCLKLQEMMAD